METNEETVSPEDRAAEAAANIMFGEEDAPETASEAAGDEIEASEGEDSPDEEDALEAVSEDETGFVEIEYEGATYEVPEALKDALLRQSDYTQKTQTLAEQRKQVELAQKQIKVTQDEQKFVQDIQPELNNIGYLQAQIHQLTEELQTNAANLSSEELFRKKIELDGQKEQLNALSQGLQQKYREFEEAQKQSYQELLEQGAQVLKKAIPNWSEEKQREVRDYALSKGFTQQEVSSIVDPRHVQILWAANQYEQLKGKAKPVKEAVKTIQPKARSPKQTANDKKLALKNRLRAKSPDHRTQQRAMEDFMKDRFGI